MFYSQRENIWFRLFYPRLKVVSEKHWLCHWSEWNFIHYRSDSSFKYMSNVPCHGLIHFRPASKLCLRGWICIQAFPKSCFLWLMLWSDHVRILNHVSKQGGKPTFFCYDITGFGYEKPAALQGYSCAISVACGNQSRAFSYCSALHHSLSQNSQICIQAIQWSYFYSQWAGSAPRFSECESPPEAHLWSGQQSS